MMSLIIPPNDVLRGPTNATTTKSRRNTRHDRTVATAKKASAAKSIWQSDSEFSTTDEILPMSLSINAKYEIRTDKE